MARAGGTRSASPPRLWAALGVDLFLLLAVIAAPCPSAADAAVYGLQGRIVVLDPGHGGRDSGRIVGNVHEADVNLDIAHRLARELGKAGVLVVMTRTGRRGMLPEDKFFKNRQRAEMESRIQVGERIRPDAYLSLHCNAWPGGSGVRGAQVFVADGAMEASSRLGEALSRELLRHTPTRRPLSRRLNHFILRHLTVPVATVEMGFLTDGADLARLRSAAYRERLAHILTMGLVSYFTDLSPTQGGQNNESNLWKRGRKGGPEDGESGGPRGADGLGSGQTGGRHGNVGHPVRRP